MLGKFWEAIGSKLADRYAAVTAPAIVFWIGGALAWAYHHGSLSHLSTLTRWLDKQSSVTQLAVIIAVLAAIAASGLIIDRLTTPVLRLLEGYWPPWLGRLRRWMLSRVNAKATADDNTWKALSQLVFSGTAAVTAEKLSEFAKLDQRRRRRPDDPKRYMPTRIGNILRSAETKPYDKYGLDAVVVWPRLWLLLPDATRDELVAARAALDSSVAATVWGVLFCGFAIWTVLAIPLGLVVAVSAVAVWTPGRAETFADLVESAYDLYRTDLYKQLRWPPPTNPAQEHVQGQLLTSYLWRGSDDPGPSFTTG
jgi:hypothetical protein